MDKILTWDSTEGYDGDDGLEPVLLIFERGVIYDTPVTHFTGLDAVRFVDILCSCNDKQTQEYLHYLTTPDPFSTPDIDINFMNWLEAIL